MHLKNFSLISQPEIGYNLSPAYDLVATTLVNPADNEESALTLNGKKKNLRKKDFVAAMQKANLEERQIKNIFNKMHKVKDQWLDFISISFLSDEFKSNLQELILARLKTL